MYFKFPLIANAFVAVEIDGVVVAGVVVEVGVVVVVAIVAKIERFCVVCEKMIVFLVDVMIL